MLNDNWYLDGDGQTVKDLWSATTDETMQLLYVCPGTSFLLAPFSSTVVDDVCTKYKVPKQASRQRLTVLINPNDSLE